MAVGNGQDLSPRQKAAILIMSLPPELSSQVVRSFPPEEVQALTMEMSKTPAVPQNVKDSVIKEFLETHELAGAAPFSSQSSAKAKDGERDKRESRGRLARPFQFLLRADPKQVLALIENENPQTIAFILSNLTAAQATAVLQDLQPPLQTEVARRLADVGKVRPEVLADVEKVLEEHYYLLMDRGFQETNGKEALLEILNRSDRTMEEKILSGLARKNPRLAKDLKTKLCEFDDLAQLRREDIQQLLKVTDMRDLVYALKGASSEIARKIYEAIPPERAHAVQNDVESLKVGDWEEIRTAQQQVRNNLRGLVIIGKIKLTPAGDSSNAPD